MKNRLATFLILLCCTNPAAGFNEEAASDQWGSAFEWLQTGRNLTETGQTPLALGSFIEALKQFEIVADKYPDYETKMVNYRIKALNRDIEKLKSELSPDDLAVAQEYIAFIHLLEQADDARFSARKPEALAILQKAKGGLDTIVARRPDAFGPAVEKQNLRLKSDIAWLEKLVAAKARLPMKFLPKQNSGYRIAGTTEFIKESDLPDPPGMVATTSLFP